jgi:hypothetical protein
LQVLVKAVWLALPRKSGPRGGRVVWWWAVLLTLRSTSRSTSTRRCTSSETLSHQQHKKVCGEFEF